MDVVIHEASSDAHSESVKFLNGPDVGNLRKSKTDDESTTATTFIPSNPIDIQFTNIVYTVKESTVINKLTCTKGSKKVILKDINGRFPPGQLIAIMGPSGAGKSTLLDILSGYKYRGVDATVYTNGVKRNVESFRRKSCYITQDDRLQGLLTIEENMQISADIKLATNVPQSVKKKKIDEILNTLGLLGSKKTLTSDLSGGQKKRLSIALELVNDPLVMFLDEPTTGLDSSSCSQCVKLLKNLAGQGRTIVCTIHQPSASLFYMFDQVYVLAAGQCLYQGTTQKLISFLQDINIPCPEYHNPADYVIELACGEHGSDKISNMVQATQNGNSLKYFEKPDLLENTQVVAPEKADSSLESKRDKDGEVLEATSPSNQLKILLRRGYIKTKRDKTLTKMRIMVNLFTALMLGTLFWNAGSDGSKVLDNYNLLFSILMHHMMSTMMLTILTFPYELTILIKEHFNRWYSLKMYYTSVTLIDIPISVVCCLIFTAVIYWTTGQPLDWNRFSMFYVISQLIVFVAQSFGLMVGAVFNVVNGTFLGPTLSVPIMMFAGFGVTLRDLPTYLHWGSYISYLRYGLEGLVGAIYGSNRSTLDCPEDKYCHYKYPKKFLEDVALRGDQFWNDVVALILILFFVRTVAYVLLRYKLQAVR